MKNLLIFAILTFILSSCSGSKVVELDSLVQSPCKGQTELKNSSQFQGETVNNLVVYQKGSILYTSMEVRTYSNARLKINFKNDNNKLKLFLVNENNSNDNSICNINVTTTLKNVQPGAYEVMVLNSSGRQLLATKKITFKD